MAAPSLALQPPALGPEREVCPDVPGPVLPDGNAELQSALLPPAAHQVHRIAGSQGRILDNLREAVDKLSGALEAPARADAATPTLLDACAAWAAEKAESLLLDAVNKLGKAYAGVAVQDAISDIQSIYERVQAGRAAAAAAQRELDARDHFGALTAALSYLKTALAHRADSWAVQAQVGWERADPAAQQAMIAHLRGIADELHLSEYRAGSYPAALASLAGGWARGRGGQASLVLSGEAMQERELRFNAPFSAQFGGTLAAADADLRDLGVDLHVTWLPEPGMPLLAVKALVPTGGGEPAITYSSNGIDPRYRARLLAFLRDPCSYIYYTGE